MAKQSKSSGEKKSISVDAFCVFSSKLSQACRNIIRGLSAKEPRPLEEDAREELEAQLMLISRKLTKLNTLLAGGAATEQSAS